MIDLEKYIEDMNKGADIIEQMIETNPLLQLAIAATLIHNFIDETGTNIDDVLAMIKEKYNQVCELEMLEAMEGVKK